MTTEPIKPKPRRRFWQYSLRTMLVMLTVFCVWLGWTVHGANEQRKAVEWVREMGGTVWYDYQLDEKHRLRYNSEPSGPRWLVQLLGVDHFQEVSFVGLNRTQSNAPTPLPVLKSLKLLDLNTTPVSDLTPLAGLKNLRVLALTGMPVSDLTPLAKLTSLESLRLTSTKVNDLTSLAGLKNLEVLWLNGTAVSDEQVEELRRALPNCKIIWWTASDPSL